jgi:uncharacterized protein YciI
MQMTDKDALKKRLAEIEAPLLKRKVWAIFSRPVAPLEQLLPVLPDHYEWVIGQEKQGRVVGSGPFLPVDRDAPMTGEGMTVIRANSYQEAVEIAKGDPFVVAGLRDFTIRPWQINEGSVTATIKLSENAFEIE